MNRGCSNLNGPAISLPQVNARFLVERSALASDAIVDGPSREDHAERRKVNDEVENVEAFHASPLPNMNTCVPSDRRKRRQSAGDDANPLLGENVRQREIAKVRNDRGRTDRPRIQAPSGATTSGQGTSLSSTAMSVSTSQPASVMGKINLRDDDREFPPRSIAERSRADQRPGAERRNNPHARRTPQPRPSRFAFRAASAARARRSRPRA